MARLRPHVRRMQVPSRLNSSFFFLPLLLHSSDFLVPYAKKDHPSTKPETLQVRPPLTVFRSSSFPSSRLFFLFPRQSSEIRGAWGRGNLESSVRPDVERKPISRRSFLFEVPPFFFLFSFPWYARSAGIPGIKVSRELGLGCFVSDFSARLTMFGPSALPLPLRPLLFC